MSERGAQQSRKVQEKTEKNGRLIEEEIKALAFWINFDEQQDGQKSALKIVFEEEVICQYSVMKRWTI